MRKVLAVALALVTFVALTGETSCGETGTSGSEATGQPAKPKKVTVLSIEVEWPETYSLPVTIYWNVPDYMTGRTCEAGARMSASKEEKAKHAIRIGNPTERNPLVQRMIPPLVCDWTGYHDGDKVSVTIFQPPQRGLGLLRAGIWVDGREVATAETRKADDIQTAVYPVPKEA